MQEAKCCWLYSGKK